MSWQTDTYTHMYVHDYYRLQLLSAYGYYSAYQLLGAYVILVLNHSLLSTYNLNLWRVASSVNWRIDSMENNWRVFL